MGHCVRQAVIPVFAFLMLCSIFETSNAFLGLILQPKFEVRVENDILLEGAAPVTIHCASGDDDLGYHTLDRKVYVKWVFRENLFLTTRFFCHFWWEQKQRAFDVFYSSWSEFCNAPKGTRDRNMCYWVIKPDGFYFSNTAKNPRLERKYTWDPVA